MLVESAKIFCRNQHKNDTQQFQAKPEASVLVWPFSSLEQFVLLPNNTAGLSISTIQTAASLVHSVLRLFHNSTTQSTTGLVMTH